MPPLPHCGLVGGIVVAPHSQQLRVVLAVGSAQVSFAFEQLGEPALELFTALLHREPKRSNAHVEQLYDLFEAHGESAMRRALERVVRGKTLSIEAVARALTNKLGGAR
jgi:hypothetical protein